MKTIRCHPIQDRTVCVPGSKSLTHRILIAAALAQGTSRIDNALISEDTCLTMGALEQMGIRIERQGRAVTVHGLGGRFEPCPRPIDLGNSGTSMRLLTAVAALGKGEVLLTGSERMCQRPIGDLVSALNHAGVTVRAINDNGCPPVRITANPVPGGPVAVNGTISSQYLSGLLLLAPCTLGGLAITVAGDLVSRPYVDLTLAVLERFGITVERQGYRHFLVKGGQAYRAGAHTVAPDACQAGYFWAAAAITGACITVAGVLPDSHQGDARFVEVLAAMGCTVRTDARGLAVTGGPLRAVDVDMADMPDLAPTLAVVAAFATGDTRIGGVAHLKAKESDRLAAVISELAKMGVAARSNGKDLVVTGSRPRGAVIETYNDHRIAMSFALAGLVVPGVVISGEGCVAKSFPNFWEVFESL
jgi:3-phosphoshikimate 1-carboxyvinyltransferase